jgi:tRNA(Ile)-lysidine synthase TilS/MesJ
MQKLMSYMRRAMENYNMIEDGDRVAVGLSGGKDSVSMLAALAQMRKFYPKTYELVAITLDPHFNGEEGDYSLLEELCERLEVDYILKRTWLWDVVFEERQEKNPCSLCARMRRGALHNASIDAGCNKIALGHHLDDVAETFLMNLLNGGSIGSFSPVTYLSRKDLYLIRPMIFARERDCARVVKSCGLPVVKSKCPVDGTTERQEIKALLNSLEKKYGDTREKILGAMQRGNISGY